MSANALAACGVALPTLTLVETLFPLPLKASSALAADVIVLTLSVLQAACPDAIRPVVVPKACWLRRAHIHCWTRTISAWATASLWSPVDVFGMLAQNTPIACPALVIVTPHMVAPDGFAEK